MYFAREGWKKEKALGFFTSPFSAIGRAKGYLVKMGLKVVDLYHLLRTKYKIPAAVAAGIIGVSGVILLVFCAILFVWLGEKEKYD
jgi:hypothetical protein